MKKSAVLVPLFIMLIFAPSLAKSTLALGNMTVDSWASSAPLQQARGGLGVVTVDNKIYAIGGSVSSGLYPPDLLGGFVGTNEEYDPATGKWTYKTSMPTPRDSFAIAAYQDKIYCIAGAVGVKTDEKTGFLSYVTSGINEMYDTTKNTWVARAPMPVTGKNIQANVVNGEIYVIGKTFTYVYNPIYDSWAQRTRAPISFQSSIASIAVGDKIIVTGEASNQSETELKILIYDTEADSWSEGNASQTVVVGSSIGATMGANALRRIYVLGLVRGIPPTSLNLIYDLKEETWSLGAAMPTARMDFGVAVAGDIIYAIGGYYISSPASGYVTASNLNEQYIPVGYGTPDPSYVPPVALLSPLNQTYNESTIPLNIAVNKPVDWVRYSLDGKENITVTGNLTLIGLAVGSHNLTLYAKEQYGIGLSKTVSFRIVDQPTSLAPIAAASIASTVAIATVLVLLHRRHPRQ